LGICHLPLRKKSYGPQDGPRHIVRPKEISYLQGSFSGGREGFDLSRVFGAAPLADDVMMGVLRPFGKVHARPPVPQVARADEADREDHGGADEQRLAEADMTEGKAVIDRAERLAGKERAGMHR